MAKRQFMKNSPEGPQVSEDGVNLLAVVAGGAAAGLGIKEGPELEQIHLLGEIHPNLQDVFVVGGVAIVFMSLAGFWKS